MWYIYLYACAYKSYLIPLKSKENLAICNNMDGIKVIKVSQRKKNTVCAPLPVGVGEVNSQKQRTDWWMERQEWDTG